ncbi:hypothetical protein ACP70R_008268 [Stipagrostis hirtigluma subsp. patula]
MDANILHDWLEGIITQNYEADETKFVVQVSVAGVDARNLRPSVVWKDGQWTEWFREGKRKYKCDTQAHTLPLDRKRRTCQLQASCGSTIGGEPRGPSKDKRTSNTNKMGDRHLPPLPPSMPKANGRTSMVQIERRFSPRLNPNVNGDKSRSTVVQTNRRRSPRLNPQVDSKMAFLQGKMKYC